MAGFITLVGIIIFCVCIIVMIIDTEQYDRKSRKKLEEIRKLPGFDRLQYYDLP